MKTHLFIERKRVLNLAPIYKRISWPNKIIHECGLEVNFPHTEQNRII